MAPRYGIVTPKAFGVPMATIQRSPSARPRSRPRRPRSGRPAGTRPALLAGMVDDPARVTPAQMDRWARDFDNWAISTPSASSSSIAPRTPAARSTPWAAGATSSSSAPASRSWPASRCTASAQRRGFLRGLPLIERGRDRRAQLREEGRRAGRCAPSAASATRAARRRPRLAARLAASPTEPRAGSARTPPAPSPRRTARPKPA